MSVRPKLALEQQFTIEEFLAFTAGRPDGESWELVEGAAVLNPSPIDYHQIIVVNISGLLWRHKAEQNAPWFVLAGTGTRVPASTNSLPQPDVMVKELPPTGSPVSDDALVIFEVLSRSNTKADQAWRRQVYTSVPNCQHYVTIDSGRVDATVYSRSVHWAPAVARELGAALLLPALGLSLPLSDVYRWTPMAAAKTEN